jgi:hypothetical protein
MGWDGLVMGCEETGQLAAHLREHRTGGG